MGYKRIEVDFDLDDFDTDELVDELISRINQTWSRKQLTDLQKKQLLETIEPLFEELSPIHEAGLEINTLDDEMKRDHLVKVWNKYTSSQLEQLIP